MDLGESRLDMKSCAGWQITGQMHADADELLESGLLHPARFVV
jgi:hypothetical protein